MTDVPAMRTDAQAAILTRMAGGRLARNLDGEPSLKPSRACWRRRFILGLFQAVVSVEPIETLTCALASKPGRFVVNGRVRWATMPKPNPANAAIARRLVQAREAAGLTFDAAVIRLAMHRQTYAYHEQGVTSVKSVDLRRYAEAFGVSHGWLGTGIGVGPKKMNEG